MKRKKERENKKRCSICGKLIVGKGMKVLIEGANVVVCQNCGAHTKKF